MRTSCNEQYTWPPRFAMIRAYNPGPRQSPRKVTSQSGSAACRAESLWLSGAARLLLPLRSAGRLSLPAEPRRLVRAEALGKAKPFRTAGGRAAFSAPPDATLADSQGREILIRERTYPTTRGGGVEKGKTQKGDPANRIRTGTFLIGLDTKLLLFLTIFLRMIK